MARLLCRILLASLLMALPITRAQAKPLFEPEPLFAIRLDPGRLYDLQNLQSLSVERLASHVAHDIVRLGFNTVFLYVYSPVYGSYGSVSFPLTRLEPHLGRKDFVGHFLKAAQRSGLRVVATIPLNDFKSVWEKRPAWRMMRDEQKVYKPFSEAFLLSIAEPEFQKWHQGFARALLVRYPSLAGLEAVEPTLDHKWEKFLEPRLLKSFEAHAPGVSATWPELGRFRARALTNTLVGFNRTAHEFGKEAHIVQTWPALEDGSLMKLNELAQATGLDLEAMASLNTYDGPDFFNIEFIWQQWQAEYGPKNFTPTWVSRATEAALNSIRAARKLIVHVELSEFTGKRGFAQASIEEVRSAIGSLPKGIAGYDVYDYVLWKQSESKSLSPSQAPMLRY